MFIAVGFNRAGVRSIEREELERSKDAPVSRAIAKRLDGLFGSRSGPWLRLLMPFVLLAAVYVPLRRALNEVAWEVLVRAAVQSSIAKVKQPIVQSRVRVERHRVDVAVVLLGKSSDADAARDQLDSDVRPVAGVAPHLEIVAIPDATAFAGLESTLRTPVAAPAPTVSQAETLEKSREYARSVVDRYFPVDAAGPILQVDFSASGAPLLIEVVHAGKELPRSAVEVLERSIATDLERQVHVTSGAIPSEALSRGDDDYRFIAELSSTLKVSERVHDLAICVTRPPEPPPWRPASAREKAITSAVLALVADRKEAVIEQGKAWSVRFARGTCVMPGADAGAPLQVDAGTVADAVSPMVGDAGSTSD